jgi:hypothetical protein
MCFYLVVEAGLPPANDPEIYVRGSVATGRVCLVEKSKGTPQTKLNTRKLSGDGRLFLQNTLEPWPNNSHF